MDQEVGRVAEFVSEAIDQSAGNSYRTEELKRASWVRGYLRCSRIPTKYIG